MPEILPVFPVFDIERSAVDAVRIASNLPDGAGLDRTGDEVTFVHPAYGEMLIGRRDGPDGRERYAVMLLTTDQNLYDHARQALTEWN